MPDSCSCSERRMRPSRSTVRCKFYNRGQAEVVQARKHYAECIHFNSHAEKGKVVGGIVKPGTVLPLFPGAQNELTIFQAHGNKVFMCRTYNGCKCKWVITLWLAGKNVILNRMEIWYYATAHSPIWHVITIYPIPMSSSCCVLCNCVLPWSSSSRYLMWKRIVISRTVPQTTVRSEQFQQEEVKICHGTRTRSKGRGNRSEEFTDVSFAGFTAQSSETEFMNSVQEKFQIEMRSQLLVQPPVLWSGCLHTRWWPRYSKTRAN